MARRFENDGHILLCQTDDHGPAKRVLWVLDQHRQILVRFSERIAEKIDLPAILQRKHVRV
ncbi:hypothetical protein At15955_54430 (plasmid) [Agrobacterium tumefaciens]|uniref:Uncharacterized protein n=1 Tax=Agrobacterium tumefaciens TaxID=358 RepID=A0A2L2LLS0_AGRTU|nr:hypothetical protein Ach5_51920 [Agrobacterium tumefaciens]AVH45269.1 hypothetical protein At1D1609_52360 [Agrobacterium tumefaciens]AYM20428.1 hypothetical protein At15955_54430 [Agrobacterium tumefaciens]AYM71728.1 hypothetical protein AtA6_55120 [Agrobacterium tumefaciens]SPZ48173.1 Uncharacterised protein [Agrobacterium tumefaciens]